MLKTRSLFFACNKNSDFRFSNIDQTYHVVGVLKYTNAAIDQLILMAIESVWEVYHHEEPEALREDKSDAHEPHGEPEHKEEEQGAHKEGKEILGADEGWLLVVAFNLNISKTPADA